MERTKNSLNKIFTGLIYVYFLAGVIWHLLPETKALVISFTPYGLVFFSLAILFFNEDRFDMKTITWIVSIFTLTVVFEIIGVKTHFIFGGYAYSNVLGFKLFGVPLVIGLNWTIVILGLFSLVNKRIRANIIIQTILIGTMAVFFDFILEPAATKLNYWHWENSFIPFRNYSSWFIIASIFGFAGLKLKVKFKSSFVTHYIFAQFLFLLLLDIFL